MLAELANFNQTQLFACRCVRNQAVSVPTFLEKKLMAVEQLAKTFSFSIHRQLNIRAQAEDVYVIKHCERCNIDVKLKYKLESNVDVIFTDSKEVTVTLVESTLKW